MLIIQNQGAKAHPPIGGGAAPGMADRVPAPGPAGALGLQWGRELRQASAVVGLALAAAALTVTTARSQDATWLANPGSGDFDKAANWAPATTSTTAVRRPAFGAL